MITTTTSISRHPSNHLINFHKPRATSISTTIMKGLLSAAIAIPALLANAASVGLARQTANVSSSNRFNTSIYTLLTVSQFDDIVVADAPLSLQPIGTYQDLVWDRFNVINVGNALTGVAAQSKPNVAVQYILSGGLGDTATLKPASSKTAYFSLQSFYFGCVPSSQETAAGAAIACTLTLTGKRKGKVVVTQNISFAPAGLTGLLVSPMKKQEFAGAWSNVDEVDFQQTGLLGAATSVLYDNVKYTTFTL